MKNLLKITLGVLTSVGGFLDVGAIATSAQAGAIFGPQLLWAMLLGTICIVFLVEMSGRLGAVSKHTVADALRERFGFRFFVIPLSCEVIVDTLVITSELGGVCLALQFVSGVSFRWWAFPVAFAVWLLLWKGTFGFVEKATAFLGLVTLVFVVAALRAHPPLHDILRGALPAMPTHDADHYWFLGVSVIGAVISPYLIYFYSAGTVEEQWSEEDLVANRGVAAVGMSFGSIVAIGVMLVAAATLLPAGIAVDGYEQAPLMLSTVLGSAGFYLFAASLGIACFGAAVEGSLAISYVIAQAFGWEWGEDLPPAKSARFATTYTVLLVVAAAITSTGLDPLKLTIFSMALTVVVLPVLLLPLIVLMNDEKFLGEHRNGIASNVFGVAIVIIAIVLSVIAIPLEIAGG